MNPKQKKEHAKTAEEFDRRFDEGEDIFDLADIKEEKPIGVLTDEEIGAGSVALFQMLDQEDEGEN
jgi:hypothetical protein